MTIEFSLDEKDMLAYQLYTASKSKRIQKKRQQVRIIPTLIYFILGLAELYSANYTRVFIFLIVAVLWYFIYPVWEKGYYKRHYEGFVHDKNKGKQKAIVTIQFDNDCIIAKDEGSETKILLREIEEVNEISPLIFIKLKSGPSFILPKNKIVNVDSLKIYLTELTKKLGLKYNTELEWEWK
jgi:hypothetical protein